MTEEQLAAIEARGGDDIPALVAEVRRLRAFIAQVERNARIDAGIHPGAAMTERMCRATLGKANDPE